MQVKGLRVETIMAILSAHAGRNWHGSRPPWRIFLHRVTVERDEIQALNQVAAHSTKSAIMTRSPRLLVALDFPCKAGGKKCTIRNGGRLTENAKKRCFCPLRIPPDAIAAAAEGKMHAPEYTIEQKLKT